MEYNGVKFEDRDNFILENMGLVKKVCSKFRSRIEKYNIEFDDLVNIGAIGLIKAYDNFDLSLGYAFSTYAMAKIEGEIKKYLRDYNSNGLKFSREVKLDFWSIYNSGMINEDSDYITKILGMSKERINKALEYHSITIDSMEHVIYESDKDITLANKLGEYIDFDTNLIIKDFITGLDDRQRKILNLYLQEKSQEEIGKIIGVSQVQVSRILAKIFKAAQEYGTIGGEELKKHDIDYEKAKRLAWETNLTGTQIAEETGITKQTAYKYINEFRKNRYESLGEEVDVQSSKTDIESPNNESDIEIDFIDSNISGNISLQIDADINSVEKDISNMVNMLKKFGFMKITMTINSSKKPLEKTA